MSLPDSMALEGVGAPDAMLSVDADGLVVGANPAAPRLLGWTVASLEGRRIFEVVRPRDSDGVPIAGWHPSALLPGVRGVPETEVDLQHSAGRSVKCAVTVAYERDHGKFMGGVVALRDLGNRRLESAAARAVATSAHEIRAPLTGVRGFASLLLRKGDTIGPLQRREMVEQILSDAERMTRLVGELLDVSRLEAGRLTLGSDRVQVRDVVERAVRQARMGIPDRAAAGIDLNVPGEHAVEADADKLLQILVNLVENALKYGDEPVSIRSVRLLTAADAGPGTGPAAHVVRIEVNDHGYVPEDVLRRIFSKYWKRERPGRPSGTGLGLYIAKALAEAQGGVLDAVSSRDEGTTFRVTMIEA